MSGKKQTGTQCDVVYREFCLHGSCQVKREFCLHGSCQVKREFCLHGSCQVKSRQEHVFVCLESSTWVMSGETTDRYIMGSTI